MLAFTPSNPHAYTPIGRRPADMGPDSFRESIRELARRRARKAQWLPDEVDDSDDELEYNQLGPDDHRYPDAMRTQQRVKNEYEARARAMQEEAERRRQAVEEQKARELKRAQDLRQRASERLGRQMQQTSDTRTAAVEREANLRAERIRQQQERNAFTAGRSPFRNRVNTPGTASSADPALPSPKANPIPQPTSRPHQKTVYTEEHEAAASIIQQRFRIHQSLQAIDKVASEFQALKNAFKYPSVVDFQKRGSEGGHISVHTTQSPLEFDKVEEVIRGEGETSMEVDEQRPKLAYTPVNYSVHSYVDAMEKLLMRLDGVDSWGVTGIREKRRSVVREIGEESARLDRYCQQVWTDYVEKQNEGERKGEEQEVRHDAMEVDDEKPVYVEHPNGEDSDEWLDVAELVPNAASPDAGVLIGGEDSSGTSSLAELPTTGSSLSASSDKADANTS